MSVIGRLDGQVNEILITPLQRNNRQETNEQEDEQPSSRETKQIEPDSSRKIEDKRYELPVWLL
jgi:hypothetical protein